MSVTSRARSVTRTGLKVQRRVAIAQALFWPTLILTAVAVAATTAVVVKRRRAVAPPPLVPVPAGPALQV